MFGLGSLFGQSPKEDFPPKPKWKPTIKVDIGFIADRAAYYTNNSKIIVIFREGTCVCLAGDTANPAEEAKKALNAVFNFHPDFNPLVMDDGNFAVVFSQKNCFAVVSRDEFERNRDYIEKNHLDGIVKDEVLLNAEKKANVFDDRGKIGLLGRARMFMDAVNPVVVKVVKPHS